jgi:hypothetical protein
LESTDAADADGTVEGFATVDRTGAFAVGTAADAMVLMPLADGASSLGDWCDPVVDSTDTPTNR